MADHAADDANEIDHHWSARLTEPVAERWRWLREGPIDDAGDFVLCWLHHAVRDHDNPAIDLAVTLGNALARPVLIYQGLAGNHRYNSDRHHVFIMQGARDLQAGLARRDIAYAFHLPADPAAPSPLRDLARRACAVVTEDFPAPPMPRWTHALAERSGKPMIAVDCACVAPMRLVSPDQPQTRAFAFRKAAQKMWKPRYRARWQDIEPTVDPLPTDADSLGFAPLDLQDADLPALAAGCDIDHAVPPVPRAVGGSAAGYARWQAFLDQHLDRYDNRRNDAADIDAVSCLSPYLHHGHVSPFRVAREASDRGGSGAHKFLDELLTWRELAHHFCFHHPGDTLDTLAALPGWARGTLDDHADDEREALYTWETLSRAATDDAMWNAMQRSLLRNGELHNNVRMTWGKMIPRWSRTPAEALHLLVDLNHRYALDGNDPNSYGGLLWCLGQFDRPFPPPLPVIGTLRDRTTAIHAKRLKPQKYAAAVAARHDHAPLRVAVIGAGIAGLACARALHDHGCDVVVYDRGRRVGGRMSSRSLGTDGGELVVDHGCPHFTVADPRFGRHVRSWIADGVAARWDTPPVTLRDRKLTEAKHDGPLIVGTPDMAAIARHLAEPLTIATGVTVASIDRQGNGWVVVGESIEPGDPFDAVVLAMAPPQATRLLGDDDNNLKNALGRIAMQPTWVAMAVLDTPCDGLPGWIDLPEDPVLDKLIRADRKPGRATLDGRCAWVAHATHAWSADRYDADRDDIAEQLREPSLDALHAVAGSAVSPDAVRLIKAHRWGMATPADPSAERCMVDADRRLAVCGDGFGGTGVEAAFLSAHAAAGRVLAWRPLRSPKSTAAPADASLFA